MGQNVLTQITNFFSQHISKFYRFKLHCQVLLMTTEECSFLSMCGIRIETFLTLPSNLRLVTLNARVHVLPLEVTRRSRARLSCSVPQNKPYF